MSGAGRPAELQPLPRPRAEVAVTVDGQVVESHINDQIGIVRSIARELTNLHHELKQLRAPELGNLYARLQSLAEGCATFGVVRYSRSYPNPRPYHNPHQGQQYLPRDGMDWMYGSYQAPE